MNSLDKAIEAIVENVTLQATTAKPNDLVYLAKAIEGVGAGSQVSFLTALASNQQSAIGEIGKNRIDEINSASAAQISAISQLANLSLANISNAFSQQVSTVQALGSVSGTISVNVGAGSTITLTPNGALTVNFTMSAVSGATYWEVEVIGPGSWPVTFNNVTWDGGSAPTLAGGAKTTILYFRTRNSGAKIYGGVSFYDIA